MAKHIAHPAYPDGAPILKSMGRAPRNSTARPAHRDDSPTAQFGLAVMEIVAAPVSLRSHVNYGTGLTGLPAFGLGKL